MNTLTLLNSILFIVCLGSFSWAIRAFFTLPDGKAGKGMKSISSLGLVFAVINGFSLLTSENSSLVATMILLSSLTLFWWCIRINCAQPLSLAYSKDQPTHLITKGPYKSVRHPFYTSYILFWLATPIATHNILLILPVLIMTYLYLRAAQMEEAKFLNSGLSLDYVSYQFKTGMFSPKFCAKASWLWDYWSKRYEVTTARSSEEMDECYHLRHQVFAEELKQKGAQCPDALDAQAMHLVCHDKKTGKTIGCVRIILGSALDPDSEEYDDYHLHRFSLYRKRKLYIVQRLAVLKPYRKSAAALMLALECYKQALINKIEQSVILCDPRLKKYYARLGYRQLASAQSSRFGGKRLPLLLRVFDYQNFKGSPFYKVATGMKSPTLA